MNPEPAAHDYPPAPWRLRGQLFLSTWLVPVAKCQVSLAQGLEPRAVAGRVLVMTAAVHYQEGSVLSYHEVFAALSARRRDARWTGMTVPFIWVDSERSLRGGRELWGVPKELARFDFQHAPDGLTATSSDEQGRPILEATYRGRLGLPGRQRLGLPVLQAHRGRFLQSSPSFQARFTLASARVSIPTGSPLAALGIAGRAPLTSVWVRDFETVLDAARQIS